MGIIKKIIYMLKNKYRPCQLCNFHHHTKVMIEGFPPDCKIEDFWSNQAGKIVIECPACKGTGLIWG